jgi:hypothetical protein
MHIIFLYKNEKNHVSIIKGESNGKLLNILELEQFREVANKLNLENKTLYKVTLNVKNIIEKVELIKRNFSHKLSIREINYEQYLGGLKIFARYNSKRFRVPEGQIYFIPEKEISPMGTLELLQLGFLKDVMTNTFYCTLWGNKT